jgi:cold shock CspA family protein
MTMNSVSGGHDRQLRPAAGPMVFTHPWADGGIVGQERRMTRQTSEFAMQTGTVKVVKDRGYGFITCGTDEFFFHASDVVNCAIEDLAAGDRVEFELAARRGREQAINVRALF